MSSNAPAFDRIEKKDVGIPAPSDGKSCDGKNCPFSTPTDEEHCFGVTDGEPMGVARK